MCIEDIVDNGINRFARAEVRTTGGQKQSKTEEAHYTSDSGLFLDFLRLHKEFKNISILLVNVAK